MRVRLGRGERLLSEIFPPLTLGPEGRGMQSTVIHTGEPLLANDVAERVKDSGTYYDVDRSGTLRKVLAVGRRRRRLVRASRPFRARLGR